MSPETLAQVLPPIQKVFSAYNDPRLLVGLSISDDAAVYKITNETAIVHTLDFFTPVVDDPYDYGAIAAANSLNDVYAMGGDVVLALNICGFPLELPENMIGEILRGGAEKVAEAGGIIAGGHTINCKEPLYGLSVIGTVHPEKILAKSGAKAGDLLILTKPLGVGVITTAFKGDSAAHNHMEAAVNTMKKLNKKAAQLLKQAGDIHACTDVTGFSLIGHSGEIAEKSGVGICLHFEKLPFIDGAMTYAQEWLFPGGSCSNKRCYERNVSFASGISEEMRMLLYTPETAGGLLASVSPHRAQDVMALFKRNNETCWIVGEVKEGRGIEVTL